MDIFQRSLAHTAFWEGGKANNPRDPGGVTNMGLTQKTYDAARVNHSMLRICPASVNELTQDQIQNVFRLEFWLPSHCHELPNPLALPMFDAAINCGVSRARKWLQQALRVQVDGWIGIATINAARACDFKKTVTEFHAFRTYHYMLQDDIDADFGLGWSRRLLDTHNVALELIEQTDQFISKETSNG